MYEEMYREKGDNTRDYVVGLGAGYQQAKTDALELAKRPECKYVAGRGRRARVLGAEWDLDCRRCPCHPRPWR